MNKQTYADTYVRCPIFIVLWAFDPESMRTLP